MRIGALLYPGSAAANYRVSYPFAALQQRGHDIVWPDGNGNTPPAVLRGCDAVLVYRRFDAPTRQVVGDLKRAGVGVVWDNDDDFLNMPKQRHFRRSTGRSRAQIFAEMTRIARMANFATTTTEPLAQVLRTAGVKNVEVIENYLVDPLPRPRRPHQHLTVGWIAGLEHAADAAELRIADALRRLQAEHPEVAVTAVGVDLRLEDRYGHAPHIEFQHLPHVMSEFDIGIAPLLDSPFNRSRSNIKVKEYAASQLPWLASATGPYLGLGEAQGGRLVADDGWFAALDALVRDLPAQQRLSAAGAAWSRTQSVGSVGPRYEALLTEASERARSQRDAHLGSRSPLSGRT